MVWIILFGSKAVVKELLYLGSYFIFFFPEWLHGIF